MRMPLLNAQHVTWYSACHIVSRTSMSVLLLSGNKRKKRNVMTLSQVCKRKLNRNLPCSKSKDKPFKPLSKNQQLHPRLRQYSRNKSWRQPNLKSYRCSRKSCEWKPSHLQRVTKKCPVIRGSRLLWNSIASWQLKVQQLVGQRQWSCFSTKDIHLGRWWTNCAIRCCWQSVKTLMRSSNHRYTCMPSRLKEDSSCWSQVSRLEILGCSMRGLNKVILSDWKGGGIEL